MASLGGSYDASGGQTMEDRDPFPAGEYVAALVKSDKVESKKSPGNFMISCEFEVTEGEMQGRRFWTNLNLWNSNPTAVEIAQRELNSICHAVGKLRVDDTELLHNIPMRVKIGFQKNDNTRNEVKGYKPLNSAPSGNVGAHATPQSAAGGGNAPWRKSA